MSEFRQHPWFEGLDWSIVAARRYQPPYKPRVAAQDDDSNFDDYSNLHALKHPFVLTPEQEALFKTF